MPNIFLSDNDLAVIFDQLGEGKLKICGPVFTNIQRQLQLPPETADAGRYDDAATE